MACSSIPQFEDESFWRYFTRVQNQLPSDHGFELWEVCEVIYAGLNDFTRYVVEDMHDGEFRALSLEDAWDYYNWLAQDTYEWDMGTNPRQVQPNSGIPPPSSLNCDAMNFSSHDSFPSHECLNYNDSSFTYNTNSHMSYNDSSSLNQNHDVVHAPSFDVNVILDYMKSTIESISSSVDVCSTPFSPLDSPEQTLTNFTPRFSNEVSEELLGLEYGEKEHLELGYVVNELVEKDDLMTSRASYECENKWCEEMRVEKENGNDVGVEDSRSLSDFDGDSSYVENENTLREECVPLVSPIPPKSNHDLDPPLETILPKLYSNDLFSSFFVDPSLYFNSSSCSYFLIFPSFNSRFPYPPSHRHRVMIYNVPIFLHTLTYVMFIESFASAFDKLLRSLQSYLLDSMISPL